MPPGRFLQLYTIPSDAGLHSLEAKMRLYREYHNDTGNWMRFGQSDPAEAVYRVPLTSLP